MLKKVKVGFGLGCLLLAVSCFASVMPSPQSTVQPLDKVIAIVNSDVVTQSQLQFAIKRARARLHEAHMTVPPRANLRNSVLQQLINRSLQLQVAKRVGIKVSNQELNLFITKLAQQRHVSVSQWKKMQMQQSGYTAPALRVALKDQIKINHIQAMSVAKNIKINSQDLQKVKLKIGSMQQQGVRYHLVDYLIALPDSPAAAQMKKAQHLARQLKARLKAGLSVSLSKTVTQNDMGWVRGNQLPNLFLNAVQRKASGFISAPVVAANGIHVLKLVAKQGQTAVGPSQQQIRAYAMQQQFVVGLEKWIKTLRTSAFIKVNPS